MHINTWKCFISVSKNFSVFNIIQLKYFIFLITISLRSSKLFRLRSRSRRSLNHNIKEACELQMEKVTAPHSSTLAWKTPWTEEPGSLQSMGSLRIWHDWATSLSLFSFMHWRRKWQPTPVFPGMGEPGGLPSVASHRVGHDWSDLAAGYEWKKSYLRT